MLWWTVAVASAVGAASGPLALRAAVRSLGAYPDSDRADDEQPLKGRWLGHPLTAAVLFGTVAWAIGPEPELPAFLALAWTGVALAITDLTAHRLPNILVGCTLALTTALLTVAAAIDGAWPGLARGLLAAVAMFAVYAGLWLFGAWGGGDVKYALVLGLCLGWLGWRPMWQGLTLGFLAAGVMVLGWLAARTYGRGDKVPFGPAMGVGALAAILLTRVG